MNLQHILSVKFGKISDPHELEKVNFSLPPTPDRSLEILAGGIEKKAFKAYVGCPMWGNKAWIGKLYPPKTKPAVYLKHYARSFNGIELNSTHYRTPSQETVARWRDMAGENFRFSPKILQSISHHHRLMNCQDQIDRFVAAIDGFGPKLGCSFVQLPPNFTYNSLSSLEWFLAAAWPSHHPIAIEFRHESWFENQQLKDPVLDLLEATDTTALITDVAGRRDVLHAHLSNRRLMIRFVGNGLVASDYSRADAWIQRIREWVEKGLEELYFFVHEPDDTFAPDMGAYIIQQLNELFGLGLAEPQIHPEEGSQMSLF